MSSADYVRLMSLIFRDGKRVEKIVVNLGTDTSTLTFTDGSIFQSTEHDVAIYALHLKHDLDSEGNPTLTTRKDFSQYYADIDFLADRDQALRRTAMAALQSGTYTFAFDPDELLARFLAAPRRKSAAFLPLKTEHHYIAAYNLLLSQVALNRLQQVEQKVPGFMQAHLTIDRLFMRAFRSDSNVVRSYLRQQSATSFALEEFVTQAQSIINHADTLKSIFPSEGVLVDKGITLLLDHYRRYTEGCIKPLNLLRMVKEVADGNLSPKRKKSAMENKQALQGDLGTLLDCYDPRIRNSESHLSTVIDRTHQKVSITNSKRGKSGTPTVLAEYSYQELASIMNQLQNMLYPVLLLTIDLEWRTMLLLIVCGTAEYQDMLLAIANS